LCGLRRGVRLAGGRDMDKAAVCWQLDHLSVSLGQVCVVQDVSLEVSGGQLVALVGANGAGKSSLVRAGLGLLPVAGGQARINGLDASRMKAGERARHIGYLPQSRPLAWPLAVRDVVALGRFSYGAAPGQLGPLDRQAVEEALRVCGLAQLAGRSTDTLSGGELARVHVARALAGQAPILIADEPTAALDPAQALCVMEVLADFCARGGAAVIILHDLSLAARFAHRVVVMSQGRLLEDAAPTEALRPDILRQAFCIDARLVDVDGHAFVAVNGHA
jgi:iron complex transport system ATP-binding protein